MVAAVIATCYRRNTNETVDDKAELDRLRDQVESMGQLKSLPFSNSTTNSFAAPKAQETVKEGSLLWEFETGSYVNSSPAIGSHGTVYVGSADKKLYSLKYPVPDQQNPFAPCSGRMHSALVAHHLNNPLF